MAEGDATTTGSSDPFSDMVGLVAGPIAAGIRSIEQLRRGVDEFLRGVENFNATMENLNETAARINRLLGDIEEPVRAAMPQISRTVRTADDISQRMANFPVDVAEFMRSMMELSKRLAPLVGLAESAGGMFGLRIPGFGMGRAAPSPPPPPAAEPESAPDRTRRAARSSANRPASTRAPKSSMASKASKPSMASKPSKPSKASTKSKPRPTTSRR
ncbi:MAG: hypothetical protein M3Q72_05490 [Actinomycetota bacterium]|nr:hypothetical protein [Actinomycetota bacterium]